MVMEGEKFHSKLSKHKIKWRFNLFRAPWWGGQFERLVGIFKFAFYKVVGKGFMTFEELSEVVLDVEICMNNWPLNYVENDIEFPTLESYHIEDGELRKRAKYLREMKNHMWKWHSREGHFRSEHSFASDVHSFGRMPGSKLVVYLTI